MSDAATTIRTLIAVLLTVAVVASAAEKAPLRDEFQNLYADFGQKTMVRLITISGPKAVTMRRDQLPGKQWMVTTGSYNFKLTIQDKADCSIERLMGRLEKLPAIYLSAGVAASDDGEEGIAVYADLGGATSSGGLGTIDMLPTADAAAMVRALGRALAEEATSEDETVPEQWVAASKKDAMPVCAGVSSSWGAEIEAYAELYAVCMVAKQPYKLTLLGIRSHMRFALWTKMVASQVPILGQTPAVAKVSEAQIAEAKKLGVPVAFTNELGMKFVLVPAGTFMMGSRDSVKDVAQRCNMPQAQRGWFVDEAPRHEVTLSAFYMSIHEVTQGQYAALMRPSGDDRRRADWLIMRCPAEFQGATTPVVLVSRDDSEKFFKALSQREAKDGRRYSLPTEAQWEYACRAGSTTPFSFGETLSTDQANYDGAYTYADGKQGETRGKTVAVGSLPANAWGLHEMHGNVSEWCHDWHADYVGGPEADPKGPEKGVREHVIRGGAWRSYPGACRSACRLQAHSRFQSHHVGFRAVCALPALPAKPEKK
ncbi:MAG: formylglycine-generating enzyme family protein [Verrucomicrobia bacterium]|jgi:formylglycine-generating enzyme required for sulfatase activity|nr:formylglycine-generating enzyme family protein [Verrucomicrobiota bacterium]MBT7068970.1 formylglycine-generating enzyme family protein [Verrucomicrobiota bacterium]MBT7700818.1 formylglycine-generating enzyme family protein [Verrucomicrobiota bacterium]